MSEQMFLSPEEVRVLTGLKLAAYQERFLKQKGVNCWVNARNECVVMRAAIAQRFGIKESNMAESQGLVLDFSRLDDVD